MFKVIDIRNPKPKLSVEAEGSVERLIKSWKNLWLVVVARVVITEKLVLVILAIRLMTVGMDHRNEVM